MIENKKAPGKDGTSDERHDRPKVNISPVLFFPEKTDCL